MLSLNFLKRPSPTASILRTFQYMVDRLIEVADLQDAEAEKAATKADKSAAKHSRRQSKLACKEARKQERLLAEREAALKEADDARAAAARIQQHIIGNQA